ncbi:MAG: glycosyltransferase [Bacillota bacterium]
MTDEIKVSILCLAYNHEKYITQTLESFLMQKTSFNYEIIIHNDKSTDKTYDIINDYISKYPKKIKVINQIENQYSLGVNIIKEYLFPSVRGKYVAFCEGDDYWVSDSKLQLQYDFMESHEEYALCVHSCEIISERTEKKIGGKRPFLSNRIITTEEIISKVRNLFPFNSLFFRSDIISKLPEYTFSCTVTDFPLSIAVSMFGKSYYFDTPMSIYRSNSKGSWSVQIKKNTDAYLSYNKCAINFFSTMDKQTNGKFHNAINQKIDEFKYEKLLVEGNLILVKKYYFIYYKILPIKSKIRLKFRFYFGLLNNIVRKINAKKQE